ncbi:hypothetical protein DFQ26_007350 [Actinomortierella ambigua]|nr:hypothetical protein DFQ26_007350 [Actinomortierella ambigua]
MKSLFKRSLDKFGGTSWSLPSGAIVDDRLREVVEALPHESALHSFIVEDVDALLALFDDAKDKEEITRTMDAFLGDHGWNGVGKLLAETPSEESRHASHKCVAQVLDSYQRDSYAFLRQASEAWLNHNLWGFLLITLSAHPLFVYRPGEITSESSANRLEICWMEAVKMDGGLNTTKSPHDTLKLMKLMKDGHDMAREKAHQDVRYRLATASSVNVWIQSTISSKTSRVKDWIAPTTTSPRYFLLRSMGLL